MIRLIRAQDCKALSGGKIILLAASSATKTKFLQTATKKAILGGNLI
ncbi:hypothetical protein [Pantoea vagans]|nr:hypothetical protein [Pantoea vagans]